MNKSLGIEIFNVREVRRVKIALTIDYCRVFSSCPCSTIPDLLKLRVGMY